jgi:hypothetical protein
VTDLLHHEGEFGQLLALIRVLEQADLQGISMILARLTGISVDDSTTENSKPSPGFMTSISAQSVTRSLRR